MRSSGYTLVVGTTADYIDWIERHDESPVLFLTAPRERAKATRYLLPEHELLADLEHVDDCLLAVQNYSRSTETPVVALACFDDERLVLAAELAQALDLRFSSPQSIRQCLDKQESKRIWQQSGVPCPSATILSPDPTAAELKRLARPCVLKPHCGSGSEHVFLCRTPKQVREAARVITSPSAHGRARATAVAEAFVDGDEFSCDFVVSDGRVTLLRSAGKCKAEDAPMGTTLAYILPATLPMAIRKTHLPAALLNATAALGIHHAICMADFIVKDGALFLLEISPRIGGDCLPHALFDAWGIDTIGAAMAFAQGHTPSRWLRHGAPKVVGLRVFAPHRGTVAEVDTRGIDDDPRVISQHFATRRGRVVVMPPEDYSSWLLGHVIFQPYVSADTTDQIHELRERIVIHYEDAAA